MKKLNLLTAAVVVALGTGCAIDDAHTAPRQQQLPEKHAPVYQATRVSQLSFSAENEVSTKLVLKLINSDQEPAFCNTLFERITGDLLPDKAEITSGSQYDAALYFLPEFDVIDVDGPYTRVNCSKIMVRITLGSKVYALKTFYPKPMPRKQGLQRAKNQYVDAVAKPVIKFLRKELDRLVNKELAVSEIDFNLQNSSQLPEQADIAREVARINNVLASTQGIVNYYNISQNTANARCTFRVVYHKRLFPQGIINYLNLSLKSTGK